MAGERDGGRVDIYAPDSDWDADLATLRAYEIMSGELAQVAVNDWVDVQETILPYDPLWGYSYQVYSTSEAEVAVRSYNPLTDLYEIVNLDPSYIYNVYRRVGSGG